MTLLLSVSLTDQHTSKKSSRCKEDSESHRIVTLEMSSSRVMVKNSREKKQQEETKKQQHVIVTKNNLLKILLQKVFEITTRSSPASLIVASHGISYAVENSWSVDSQHHL